MGSASLAAARPAARLPAQTVTTIPLQPGGLRGKNLNVSCLVLQLSLPNLLKPDVKSRMKM